MKEKNCDALKFRNLESYFHQSHEDPAHLHSSTFTTIPFK